VFTFVDMFDDAVGVTGGKLYDSNKNKPHNFQVIDLYKLR